MKTHAVKEILLECLLCVEVEPQPYEGLKVGITYPPPITIGDTVYQGEEWQEILTHIQDHPSFKCKILRSDPAYSCITHGWKDPETMPIELADQTYKVIGIEVEFMLPPGWDNEFSHCESDKKWFWNYKLEEIK